MYRIYIVLALIGVTLSGFIRNYIKLKKLRDDIKFTEEYLDYLKKYYESKGVDSVAYSWLVYKSVKMQKEIGWLGVMDYKPPAAGYMIKNYQVIVNMLSELNKSFETDRFISSFSLANQYYSMMAETLVRYLGVLSDNEEKILKKLLNPFIDFRDGVQAVLSFPLYLLQWFGLGGSGLTNSRISRDIIKIISGVVALVSFVSAIVSLFVGWNDFTKIISKLIVEIR